MSKVWLVTGSASGLGRYIAEAVLASGDRSRCRNVARDKLLDRRCRKQVRSFNEDFNACSI